MSLFNFEFIECNDRCSEGSPYESIVQEMMDVARQAARKWESSTHAYRGETICFEDWEGDPPVEDEEPVPEPRKEDRLPQSEIPYIRERLQQAGINPDDVTVVVGVYESSENSATGEHGSQVAGIINDQQEGLIRSERAVRMFEPVDQILTLADYAGRQNGLKDYITDFACAGVRGMGDAIKRYCLESRDPSMRVFNISYGISSAHLYQDVMQELEVDPDRVKPFIEQLIGKQKAEQWIETVRQAKEKWQQAAQDLPPQWRDMPPPGGLYTKANSLTDELFQAVVNAVDSTLQNNERFSQMLQEYQDITRQAAESGVTIVVCANNDGQFENINGVRLQPGAEYNWYAMSDHVIAVGAANINHTAGDRTDDVRADFSSRGTETFHPTILAHGDDVPSTRARLGTVNGTSFATPHVSAAVALMLEQNPDLTFADIKRILQASATKIAGAPDSEQGAGVLRIEDAVIAARESR